MSDLDPYSSKVNDDQSPSVESQVGAQQRHADGKNPNYFLQWPHCHLTISVGLQLIALRQRHPRNLTTPRIINQLRFLGQTDAVFPGKHASSSVSDSFATQTFHESVNSFAIF